MNMRIFCVVVSAGGTEHVCEVYACSIFHAIDLLYYRDGMNKIQEDRTKYKLLKEKLWQHSFIY